MTRIHTLYKDKMDSNTREWLSPCLEALEEGQVIFLPDTVPFVPVDERTFLEPDCLDGKHKNLSFDPEKQKLGGLNPSLKATPREDYL